MNDAPRRLLSVDVLRGFDMLVIIGLDALVHALARAMPITPLEFLSEQLSHAPWAGVHAYDLVFPLFIFLSGVSLAIVDARPSSLSRGLKIMAAGRRMIILVLLGVIYNYGWDWSWERLRLPSVLGLIGVSYFLTAATLTLFPNRGARIAVWFAITIIIASLQLAYPVPGYGQGALTPTGSVNSYVDKLLMPGRLHGGTYDPEGLVGMLSATTISLAGAATGSAMLAGTRIGSSARLLLIGLAIAAMGSAAATVYPAIKSIWTVSFDFIAIGFCMVFLAIARLLFDRPEALHALRALGRWLAPVGANAILAYMFARFFVYPLYAPLAALPAAWELAGLSTLIALQCVMYRSFYEKGWIIRV